MGIIRILRIKRNRSYEHGSSSGFGRSQRINELSRNLKTLRMTFNAIKHKKEILLKIVEELEDSRKIRADGNSLIVERAILSSDNLTNTFFAIAMLSSVIDFWREKIDFTCFTPPFEISLRELLSES